MAPEGVMLILFRTSWHPKIRASLKEASIGAPNGDPILSPRVCEPILVRTALTPQKLRFHRKYKHLGSIGIPFLVQVALMLCPTAQLLFLRLTSVRPIHGLRSCSSPGPFTDCKDIASLSKHQELEIYARETPPTGGPK